MKLNARFIQDVTFEAVPLLYTEQPLIEALWTLFSTDWSGSPVCDSDGYLTGFVSISDLVPLFPPTRNALDTLKLHPRTRGSIPSFVVKDIMTVNVLSIAEDTSLEIVLDLLVQRHVINNKRQNDRKQFISSIPVQRDGKVIGIVTYGSLLKKIEPEDTLIGDVMTRNTIPIVHPEHSLEAAYQLMKSRGERYLLVLDQDTPVGMITDVQIARHMQRSHDFSKLPVEIAMTTLEVFVPIVPEDNIEKVIPLLVTPEFGLRAFPVVEHHQLIGLISYIDILKAAKVTTFP